MQPNFFYASPHYPYNIHNLGALPMNTCWNGDTSFSTPVSAALYNTTATSSWAHTVPSFMPWVTESGTTSTESVVRFTAPFPPDPCTSQTATSWELFNNLGNSKTNANLHLKRRSDFEDSEASHKQYITEEKMAARLQELHISNQYSPHPSQTPPHDSFETNNQKPQNKIKPITTLRELEDLLKSDPSDDSRKGSLILAPEIKNLVEPEKLFAKTLLNQVQRPTMAVVLWKPPHGSVQDIKSEQTSQGQSTLNDAENNLVSSAVSATESNNNSISQADLMNKSSLGINNHSSYSLPAFSLAASEPEDTDCVMEA